mmetsp:Transcript_12212/g.36734  ORF Transcript_12212/g.36734 Transcript_12212/m.36734 type:complete len:1251 (+) Transcript_12212:1-3753(+)
MYTSGSTGKPKGCLVPTAGVWHRFGWGTRLLGFTQSDVFIQKTPATFDCSIAEMWVPLLEGCTAAVVPDGAHLDFHAVHRVMLEEAVTVAHFVPSVLSLFLDFVSPGDLPHLRQISCTGEALLLSHRTKLTAALGRPLPLVNLYGPTEASIEVSYYECLAEDDAVTHGYPIGFQGDAGVPVYVLDPSDPATPLAAGQRGEICIGGIQVAYGYLDRPELTAEKFVLNPHGPGLLYRTGDLGSRDAGGRLQYFGRADRQVKVGGVRMELGEIEAASLRLVPQLLNVAVELAEGSLVGVAVARPGERVSGGEIKAALALEMPSSYIPAEWHLRGAMPLGSAGKVDHAAVSKWVTDQRTAATWGAIYDEMYFADGLQVDDGCEEPTMDWAAYTDSFTGKMHERATIAEWVDETAKEVLAFKPRRVVEMGCGKGMILFKVASQPHVAQYIAADLSKQALGHVERTWASEFAAASLGPAGLAKLRTEARDASNFDGFGGGFDAVVCNGVSMYFPSASYLLDVLAGAVECLADGGVMHLGDVISLPARPLLVLRTARHMTHSFSELQSEETRSELLDAAKDRCYEPNFFYELHARGLLPSVAAVEVQLKRGSIMSEFSRYRYNVLLHVGPPVEPRPLVEVPSSAAASAHELAAAFASAAATAPGAALGSFGLDNGRLTADEALVSGGCDAEAAAVEVGVGPHGGVCPEEVRVALEEALPAHHAVVTWARNGARSQLDAYAVPRASLRAGLRAVELSAAAALSAEALAAPFDAERATNAVKTADAKKQGNYLSEALLNELKEKWSGGDAGTKKAAVMALVVSFLGVSSDGVLPGDTFAQHGGNSFLAMSIVASLREVFGACVSVFVVLTEPFADIASLVVASTDSRPGSPSGDGSSQWVVKRRCSRGRKQLPLLEMRLEAPSPSFVFFPMAGGSPEQFAPLFVALARVTPRATCYFVQPPGRGAREGEPHAATIEQYTLPIVDAIAEHLPQMRHGPCVFVGDSWGSVAALLVAQALHAREGFCPCHVVVSGNESLEATSRYNGLGAYDDTPIGQLSDSALEAFLRASGAEPSSITPAVIGALRADCQLYEDFTLDEATAKPLPCGGTVLLGRQDGVTARADLIGWADAFEEDELHLQRVPDSSHHIFAEQPELIAATLEKLVGGPERQLRAVNMSVAQQFKLDLAQRSPTTQATEAKKIDSSFSLLGPPCAFVAKGVAFEQLQAYRTGNFLYRSGSAHGSKGELGALAAQAQAYPVGL